MLLWTLDGTHMINIDKLYYIVASLNLCLTDRPVRVPTPSKTNMSPENHWLEDVFPIEIAPF